MEIVKYLYTEFILRDVFGKVIPGLVLLVSGMAIASGQSPSMVVEQVPNWTTPALLFAVGAAWIAAFTGQEALRLTSDATARIAKQIGFGAGFAKLDYIETDVRFLIAAARVQSDDKERTEAQLEALRKNSERHVIIKEATGNACVALLVFLAVSLFAAPPKGPWNYAYAAVLAAAVLLLWTRHRYMREREDSIRDAILELGRNPRQKE